MTFYLKVWLYLLMFFRCGGGIAAAIGHWVLGVGRSIVIFGYLQWTNDK
ncbi:MAG: hypothetical protein V7K25_23505 [Nostoc sp.]